MDYERVLSHFQVKKRYSDRAQCICPVHSDKQASLTISLKDNKILFKCHAGCDTESILGAGGLSFKDLGNYEPPKWRERLEYSQGRSIEAVYDYRAAGGKYI